MLDSMLLKEEYVFPGWMVRGIDFCYVVLLVNWLYITQYVFWLPMILIETFQNLKRWFLPFFFLHDWFYLFDFLLDGEGTRYDALISFGIAKYVLIFFAFILAVVLQSI